MITKLTIVLTNYNRPKIILPVIESILNQKTSNLELKVLVVDDCSHEAIDKADLIQFGNNVVVHRHPENRGLHAARNTGISLAKTDFVLIADDDDIFKEDSLQGAIDLILSVKDYHKYPVFQFAGTNGYIPEPFMIINEGAYYNWQLKGDFTPIINKKVFLENGYKYPEYEDIKKISCENLLWCDIANKFGIPTWMHTVIILGEDATERLTSSKNWTLKANQFARLQELTIDFMESKGFDKKYPQYYNFKIDGLITYLILANRRKEALSVIKDKSNSSFIKKTGLRVLTSIPTYIVVQLLKKYRNN